jgi:hypothetical protein
MTDEVTVSFEALSSIAQRLLGAAADLGEAGSGAPANPGGGVGAPQAAALSAHLLEQLAHLCLALESASEALDATRESYATVDRGAAGRSSGLMRAM